MSITKDLEIKISNGEAKLSEDIYVYQKDRGVELRLKLNIIRTNYRSAMRSSPFETSTLFAAATILKPNGDIISRNKVIVIDNILTFTIDKEFTDQVDEIGIYKIQFHLYDTEDNRITIPPIQFEVKELLGIIDEDEIGNSYGIADQSVTDVCTVVDDGRQMDIFLDGKYIKTIWSSGDLISTSKLNKVEYAIEHLNDRLNVKIDNVILTDDYYLEFYANETLVNSVKVQTKESIFVGDESPTEEDCVVWIDTSDNEEFMQDVPDLVLDEFRSIFDSLSKQITNLKSKCTELEARVTFLEESDCDCDSGSGGGSDDGDNDGSNDSNSTILTLEDNSTLTLEDNSILILE